MYAAAFRLSPANVALNTLETSFWQLSDQDEEESLLIGNAGNPTDPLTVVTGLALAIERIKGEAAIHSWLAVSGSEAAHQL
jgi:hypothetical protein